MTSLESRFAFSLYEYSGIPGTIICGWISSRFFQGRCAPVVVLYLAMVTIGVLLYWNAAAVAGLLGVESVSTIVYCALSMTGFSIYGPIALIGIQALSFVPKNAAGTAAGLVGLFGYLLGDAILSKIVVGQVAGSSLGWNAIFCMFVVGALSAMVISMITWRKEYLVMKERLAQ
jgi:OPA family glycerol-3-phosphate transporter-like MFS transporter